MASTGTLPESLIDHAEEFHQAAELLADSRPFIFNPTFYCSLHSIELGLNAHLALAAVPKGDLAKKKLGHDLAALLKPAEKLGTEEGLGTDAHGRRAIMEGSRGYASKGFEYLEILNATHAIGRWNQLAEKLIAAAKT